MQRKSAEQMPTNRTVLVAVPVWPWLRAARGAVYVIRSTCQLTFCAGQLAGGGGSGGGGSSGGGSSGGSSGPPPGSISQPSSGKGAAANDEGTARTGAANTGAESAMTGAVGTSVVSQDCAPATEGFAARQRDRKGTRRRIGQHWPCCMDYGGGRRVGLSDWCGGGTLQDGYS